MSFASSNSNNDVCNDQNPQSHQVNRQLLNDPQNLNGILRSNYRNNFENDPQFTRLPPVFRFYNRTYSRNYRERWRPKNHFERRVFMMQQNGQGFQVPQNDENTQMPQSDPDIHPQMHAPHVQNPSSMLMQVQTPLPAPQSMPNMLNYGQQQQQANWQSIFPQVPVFQIPQGSLPTPQGVSSFQYYPTSPTVLPVQTSSGIVHYYDYNPVYQPSTNNNPGQVGSMASTWQNQQAMVSNGTMMFYNSYPGSGMVQNGSYGMNFQDQNNYYHGY